MGQSDEMLKWAGDNWLRRNKKDLGKDDPVWPMLPLPVVRVTFAPEMFGVVTPTGVAIEGFSATSGIEFISWNVVQPAPLASVSFRSCQIC